MALENQIVKQIDGVAIPAFFSAECFRSALAHKPKAGDVFIATYPKCGTTWMQLIVVNILRSGKPLDQQRDFFLASPFLDQLGSEDSQRLMIRPGALKSHLPFHRVPWSDEAKYIYVARNPKDCCVSFYHHMRQIPVYQYSDNSFDDFFELFIRGELEFGDYFDHLLSWYEQRSRPNIFFITYEELKKDERNSVLRVAQFLGEEYSDFMKRNPDHLDKILKNCSFDNMKAFMNGALSAMYAEENRDTLLADPNIPVGRKHILNYHASLPKRSPTYIEFLRKGKIGDWANYFTQEQSERFNKRILEKTSGTDVMKLWDGY